MLGSCCLTGGSGSVLGCLKQALMQTEFADLVYWFGVEVCFDCPGLPDVSCWWSVLLTARSLQFGLEAGNIVSTSFHSNVY